MIAMAYGLDAKAWVPMTVCAIAGLLMANHKLAKSVQPRLSNLAN